MSRTRNTKNGAIRTLKLQVSRQWPQAKIYPHHEAWARAHGYRDNDLLNASNTQAFKQQASNKRQAPATPGLDKSSRLGYHRSQGQARDGQAIDICEGPLMGPRNSAAEILQQRGRYARQEKSPARARNGSCRVMVRGSRNSINQQASKDSSTVDQRARSTDKQAKPSSNRQASMDPGTSFKHS